MGPPAPSMNGGSICASAPRRGRARRRSAAAPRGRRRPTRARRTFPVLQSCDRKSSRCADVFAQTLVRRDRRSTRRRCRPSTRGRGLAASIALTSCPVVRAARAKHGSTRFGSRRRPARLAGEVEDGVAARERGDERLLSRGDRHDVDVGRAARSRRCPNAPTRPPNGPSRWSRARARGR